VKNQNYRLKVKDKPVDTYVRSYRLAIEAIGLVRKLPKDPAAEVVSDQLIRSITSVGANLQEAKAASSKRDYINFFTHALKSANESKFWLGMMRDTGLAVKVEVEPVLSELAESRI
jgi:four helix bundle protein